MRTENIAPASGSAPIPSPLTKTKQPELCRYWTTRDRAANVRLFRLASEVLRAIEAGVFHPVVGWQCQECLFRSRCWSVGVGQPNSVVRTTMVIAFAGRGHERLSENARPAVRRPVAVPSG